MFSNLSNDDKRRLVKLSARTGKDFKGLYFDRPFFHRFTVDEFCRLVYQKQIVYNHHELLQAKIKSELEGITSMRIVYKSPSSIRSLTVEEIYWHRLVNLSCDLTTETNHPEIPWTIASAYTLLPHEISFEASEYVQSWFRRKLYYWSTILEMKYKDVLQAHYDYIQAVKYPERPRYMRL